MVWVCDVWCWAANTAAGGGGGGRRLILEIFANNYPAHTF